MIFRMGWGSMPLLMTTPESYCHVWAVSSRWKRYVMGAVGKTVWNSDVEDILIETGLCKQGTANKGFVSAEDYYQSMREHKLPRETMLKLYMDAFEQWHLQSNDDA